MENLDNKEGNVVTKILETEDTTDKHVVESNEDVDRIEKDFEFLSASKDSSKLSEDQFHDVDELQNVKKTMPTKVDDGDKTEPKKVDDGDKTEPKKVDDRDKTEPKILKKHPSFPLKSKPSFKKDKIDAHYDRLPWVAAAFGRVFGLKFAPVKIPFERRLQTFAAFLWMSMFLFMGFGSLYLLIHLFFYTQYWWISACYLCYYLADQTIADRGGRRLKCFRKLKIWKHFANFFPMKIIKTVDYDPSENYIFGYHPHGILSAGALAHFGTEGTGFSKHFPGITTHPLTLPGHFTLPIYRDLLLFTGAVSCSKESLRHLLTQDKKGIGLGLVVGGAPESLYCHPGDVFLYLEKRKGFCKYALEFGAHLVPTFSFGENSIYEQYPNPPGSFIRNVQDALQKMLGFAPCLFMGRGVFQYSFGIIPFRAPINTVFGAPIKVKQVDNPTQSQIYALHQKYKDAVVELYNTHKQQYADDPEAQLIIV